MVTVVVYIMLRTTRLILAPLLLGEDIKDRVEGTFKMGYKIRDE
jgi:hypothetical protein